MSNSTDFTGKWMLTNISDIQYSDLYTNAPLPTNGMALGYNFNPNGTYTYYTVHQLINSSYQRTMYQYETGTYSASDNVLMLTPTSRKVTSSSPSSSSWNYTRMEYPPERYLGWELGQSDRGAALTVVDLVVQPDGTLAPDPQASTGLALIYQGLPDADPGSPNPNPPPTDPVIPNPTNPGQDPSGSLTGTEIADRISGSSGKDLLLGMGGDDTLIGNGGHDNLKGGDGNDVIKGSSGNDKIWGGAGSDRLWGGKGKDKFALETGLGFVDQIKDFRKGEDKFGITTGMNPRKIRISQFGSDVAIWYGKDLLAEAANTNVGQITGSDFVRLSAG